MRKEEFESDYIKNSNLTVEEFNKEFITIPCYCKESHCNGWRVETKKFYNYLQERKQNDKQIPDR